MNPRSRVWVFLFFFISGSTGLVYEVVWTRLLTLVMGNTHFSITTVLTTFMGGLALGSYVGGRFIDKKSNPLAVYALLEGAVGIYCFLIPSMIEWAFPLFQWIYTQTGDSYFQASLFRFLICGAILLIPTSFMGATLPVLSKLVSRDSGFIGRDVGTLYSINTFGAVVGALASAFLFMRLWGVHATITIAAILNVGIAGVIFFVFRPSLGRLESEIPVEPQGSTAPAALSGRVILILFCFGLSGLAALVYQVAWNRIFSLLLGSSVYAFSLILTTFILGLAVGTVCFSRWVNRFRDWLKVFGLLQVGIGVTALAALPLFGDIPFINRWVYENWSPAFASIQWSNFLIIFSLLFLPTFFMGGQFPIIIKLVAKDLPTLGHNVGRVYSSNTVGTIFGSFLAGFLLIPVLGVQNTILFAIFLNLALGLVLLAFSKSLTINAKAYALPLLLIVCLWGGRSVDAWDRAVISSGAYMPYRIEDLKEAEKKTNKILFYKEGIHTTVTTELSVSGNVFLRVNGKTDASLALDMRTQLLSGYLPMLLHPDPKTALVIGQGSGITLGAVEQFAVQQIDLVEISEAVIEGSRFFGPFNHHSLDDPRVTLLLEDGRNHVALSGKNYDVIISEPSNPWISGVGALFTLDFFKMLQKRLNPGGIACIWVHTNMSPTSFKSVTQTFTEAFPHVTMWESIVGDDYLLIGSESPYHLVYERAAWLLSDESPGHDLRRIGIRTVPDLMSQLIMDRENLKRFSGDAPVHTDDNSLLEFNAPRYIYKDERDILVRQLSPYVQVPAFLLEFEAADPETRDKVRAQVAAVSRSESQIAQIKLKARIDSLMDRAKEAFNGGDAQRALALYQEILAADPEQVMAYLNMGNVLQTLKRNDEAEAAYKNALALHPYYIFGYVALARFYIATGRAQEGVGILKPVFDWYAGDPEARLFLGLGYALQNETDRAIRQFEAALKLDPGYALAYYYLGLQYRKKDPGLFKRNLETFIQLAQGQEENERLVVKARHLLKKL